MEKILIVDDEEKIVHLYKRLLEGEGYEVFEAFDSHRATNLLVTQQDINLILLDILMPRIDGAMLYEVAKQYNPQIKIIVTSAYPLEDQKQKIVSADGYYDKSQGTEVLLSKIKDVLKTGGNYETSSSGSSVADGAVLS